MTNTSGLPVLLVSLLGPNEAEKDPFVGHRAGPDDSVNTWFLKTSFWPVLDAFPLSLARA